MIILIKYYIKVMESLKKYIMSKESNNHIMQDTNDTKPKILSEEVEKKEIDEDDDDDEFVIVEDDNTKHELEDNILIYNTVKKENPFKNEDLNSHYKLVPNHCLKYSDINREYTMSDIIKSNNNSKKGIFFNYNLSENDILQVKLLYNSFINIVNSDIYMSNYSSFNDIENEKIFVNYLKFNNFKDLLNRHKINTYKYIIFKIYFYNDLDFHYDSNIYKAEFENRLKTYNGVDEKGNKKYLIIKECDILNIMDNVVCEFKKEKNNQINKKNKKYRLHKDFKVFTDLIYKWDCKNRYKYIINTNIKYNYNNFKELIKNNLFITINDCKKNTFNINPRFYKINNDGEYKLIRVKIRL